MKLYFLRCLGDVCRVCERFNRGEKGCGGYSVESNARRLGRNLEEHLRNSGVADEQLEDVTPEEIGEFAAAIEWLAWRVPLAIANSEIHSSSFDAYTPIVYGFGMYDMPLFSSRNRFRLRDEALLASVGCWDILFSNKSLRRIEAARNASPRKMAHAAALLPSNLRNRDLGEVTRNVPIDSRLGSGFCTRGAMSRWISRQRALLTTGRT